MVLADPPIILRLRQVFFQMKSYAQLHPDTTSDKLTRGSWILQSIMEEVLDELSEVDELTMALWFAKFGRIVEWIGTGNYDILPDEVREFLAEQNGVTLTAREPEPEPEPEQLAIGA